MELSPTEKHLLPPLTRHAGNTKAAEEVPPGWILVLVPHPTPPLPFPAQFCNSRETGGAHISPGAGLPVEVFQGLELSLHGSHPLPWRCSRRAVPPVRHPAGAPSILSCVQANLSFFFHYPGMYCHLIFMYAILPDKYDLLLGNSSDVLFFALITAPIPDTAAAVLPQPGGTPVRRVVVLPNALSCQSDASKYNEKKKKKLDEYICISHTFNSWVSSQRNDGSRRLPGQRVYGKCPASQPGSARVPRSGLQGVHHSHLLKQMS